MNNGNLVWLVGFWKGRADLVSGFTLAFGVWISLSRQAGHWKGDGARCKGYCFHSGGKLASSKGDGARSNRSFDSWGPGQIPGALLFCRHTATLSWSPSQLVQEFLDHATVAMTLDRYSRVLPGMEDQTAAAMETALS